MTAQTVLTRQPMARRTRLNLALAVCCLGQFMNVALPVIAGELHFERDDLQWVNNAYTIAVCGFLLLGGRLADLFGQRRVFLFGAALFTFASLVGGAAPSGITLVLQQVMDFGPLATGLSYLPLSLGIALGGWAISPVVPKIGPRPVLVGGLLMATAGLFWLARSTFAGEVLGATALLGLGMGAVLNATTNAATAGLPHQRAGLASGLLNTIHQLGSAIGLVTLATVATARTDSELAAGESLAHALGSGYALALTGAALFTAAGVLAALLVPGRASR